MTELTLQPSRDRAPTQTPYQFLLNSLIFRLSAGKPYIPALPASPSLDIAFFSGPNAPPPSYTMPSTAQPTTYTARSTYGPIPALSSPPHEDLPLPPVPRMNPTKGNAPSTTLSPTPRTASRSPSPIPATGGVRSPSPLGPGHGDFKPSHLGGGHLQGLGLGPVHRTPTNGHPRSESSPIVHVIASSDPHSRAGHRDLPPILTTPAQTSYRSVSASSPHLGSPAGRKHSVPPALELKQSNNYRQYAPSQLLSPGKGMTSPGFSPTNVVVDSLIEEMQDEDGPAPATVETPVRKTSILDRPRPRASSRSSSYRADPLSHTPTHQTSFSPGLHDSTSPSKGFRNHYFRPAAKLTDIIQHERIQQTLLPNLSIASFLALLGALDKRWRKCISGEIVGKWVVREWGLVLGPDVAWPGLGVWEGFREWCKFALKFLLNLLRQSSRSFITRKRTQHTHRISHHSYATFPSHIRSSSCSCDLSRQQHSQQCPPFRSKTTRPPIPSRIPFRA